MVSAHRTPDLLCEYAKAAEARGLRAIIAGAGGAAHLPGMIAAMTPVLFVFLYYLLATTGELCLSPVGLSAMNRLAPSYLASLIMGAWFYMTAVGNFVAGKIGEATGGHDGVMTKQGLLDACHAAGVPAGPINRLDEVFADPQVIARGMRVELGGMAGVRSPFVFSDAELALDRPSPIHGEHG